MHFVLILASWTAAFVVVQLTTRKPSRVVFTRPRYIICQFLAGLFFSTALFWMFNFYLEHDAMRFDLNGDGMFGGPEINPEQELAMERLTNDLSRNLFMIAAGPLHFIFLFALRSVLPKSKNVMETS
jgi:hypothetical protein